MIISGRDRCCQKVTRRQGNGLLQSAWSEVGVELGGGRGEGGVRREKPEEDGKRQREDNQNGKHNTERFKAIGHFLLLFSPLIRATHQIG